MSVTQKVLLLVGLPASGKSVLAKELQEQEPNRWVRINWDSLRKQEPGPWSHKLEKRVQAKSVMMAHDALNAGKSLLIDNTNLSDRAKAKWQAVADERELPLELRFMTTSVDECIKRDCKRIGSDRVGRAVIENMALRNGMIDFCKYKKIVLVDMDGTLSDCEHRRHFVRRLCKYCDGSGVIPISEGSFLGVENCKICLGKGKLKKDWKSFYAGCYDDSPVWVIRKWVTEIGNDPDFILCVVSARPTDLAGIQTEDWLSKYEIPYDHLFMRNGGDGRPDFAVKQALLDRLPLGQIAFTIDDRNQVVDMWRRNGLICYQVAEGNF